MPKEIEFTKYKERGACHWDEAKHSIFKFNAHQEARFEWVLRCLGEIKGKIVLDIGCGDGALTCRIAQKGAEVIGLDSSEDGIRLAKQIFSEKKIPARFILAGAYEIPLESNSVDCAVLSEVIEHVLEPERILSEIQRVLKPGGKAVISTPYKFAETPKSEFHVKEYYPGELRALLAGYFLDIKIIESHPAFWSFLYTYGVPWFREREIFRWLINIFALYLKRNPFLTDNGTRKRAEYFTQITATVYKK